MKSIFTILCMIMIMMLAVAAQSPSPSSSSRATCAVECAAVDLHGNELDYSSLDAGTTECTYTTGATCSYDTSGTLINDDNACATVAKRNCASKRFNIVAALADRRRAAAARPRSSMPELDKLRGRANLRRRPSRS
ncbi:hypothetical protein BKA62DRAFT_88112 [Auriculariales sp. MPI-PUGE-AT-0066]|nr:hypothetical protein BKA62DRAFT_88112 [Auriculariales sp. MPI-PUGE-AT-0066]